MKLPLRYALLSAGLALSWFSAMRVAPNVSRRYHLSFLQSQQQLSKMMTKKKKKKNRAVQQQHEINPAQPRGDEDAHHCRCSSDMLQRVS
jgi:hypothetical protein